MDNLGTPERVSLDHRTVEVETTLAVFNNYGCIDVVDQLISKMTTGSRPRELVCDTIQ